MSLNFSSDDENVKVFLSELNELNKVPLLLKMAYHCKRTETEHLLISELKPLK